MTAQTVLVDTSDRFGRRDLDELTSFDGSTGVSLYLSTHGSGPDTAQDPIRFGNLLAAAERELAGLGRKPRDIEELLGPAFELANDHERWRYQSEGLAVFCAEGLFRSFRLPIGFEELAVVSDRFHVRPLIPASGSSERFWLLALSQNRVRLFAGNDRSITELGTGTMPTNMADALANEDPEKELQVRSSGPGRGAQFHGHGGGGEDDKAALERYFRAIDHGLSDLSLDPSVPLVLAGVAYYGPIFRAVSAHPDIVPDVVAGSPDDLSALELHAAAWSAVQPRAAARREDLVDRYRQRRADGCAVEGLADVRAAAIEGRVEVLFLPRDGNRWASPDVEGEIDVHDERCVGDVDLLDDIAQLVLHGGGEVAVMDHDDLPGDVIPMAILRYSTDP